MAVPGTGFRTVWSMALEMSFHLLEPYLYSTTLSAVSAPGTATVQLLNLGYPVPAVFVGAQLVIDTGASQEIITVTAFNANATPPTITATFALTHLAGVTIVGATFPTQASSGDPFFTTSEILSYIARAQNQFLADVPMIFALNTQTVTVGQVLQPLVCDSIEINRIASSYANVALSQLVRSGNTVTATSISPHGLVSGEKFAIFQTPDPTFDGAFRVATVIDSLHWTYSQDAANATTSGGGWAGLWLRLLEVSQTELSMQNPFYRDQFVTSLKAWWEDREGLYAFGVGPGVPSTNLPIEILCSIRDTDTLQLTDGFLTPDVFCHYIRYLSLSYVFSKDGEARDPMREKYCRMRYERGVITARRWLGWHVGMGGQQQQQMAMAGAGTSQGRRR
jgi:hypothetical protein